jgi:hypothetical protein
MALVIMLTRTGIRAVEIDEDALKQFCFVQHRGQNENPTSNVHSRTLAGGLLSDKQLGLILSMASHQMELYP